MTSRGGHERLAFEEFLPGCRIPDDRRVFGPNCHLLFGTCVDVFLDEARDPLATVVEPQRVEEACVVARAGRNHRASRAVVDLELNLVVTPGSVVVVLPELRLSDNALAVWTHGLAGQFRLP